ncbi:M14 family metallopeptidase [Spirosoma rhododendri]|uniref:Peptidase M14 n=1 Tax=Spirosoma rhododendri TaxID=2728024 RepID=A0A7L5DTR7_9BACT|nr:M14 family metallopeptidase [Spirosoma rhododendri]QJD78960.1 peptidase M14 [Spirosoma rhododendri]
MKHLFRTVFFISLWSPLLRAQPAPAPPDYQNHAQLSARLKALASRSDNAAAVESIGKSLSGNDIWVLTLGRGKATAKPALAIVAGIDGSHLAGTEMAVELAEKLLSSTSDSIRRVLDTKTIYVIPLVSPDAQAQAFAKLRFERTGNARDTDDDRDGHLNEDPFDDLNRDGQITQVRVEDPTGQYVPSKDDARVLVKADPAKGETGRYVLVSEGTDTDKDGQHNEDGEGGVAIDKNFTFDYPFFTPGSGEMPVSEPENRALLDFLAKSPNIYAVLTFGPYNNLSEAPRFDRAKTTKRIITGLLEKDATVGEQVSKLYNAQTSLKDAPAMPATKGNFAQTAYYHHGRFSFSTPGWWAPKTTAATPARRDSSATAKPTPPATATAAKGGDDNEDVRFLKWADANGLTNVYVNWTPIDHPDFPNRRAEVGGLVPFARQNPPVRFLADNVQKHVQFVTALAGRMPRIEIVNVRSESLGSGLHRVTAQVVNRGLLPTGSELGDRVRWVPKMKVELKLADKQSVVSGRRIMLRGPMAAGETMDVTFLVSGSGRVTLEAGNAMTGVQQQEINLK